MALNSCEMWSNGIKIAFYFKKLQKIALGPRGFVPRPPFVIRLGCTSLLNTSPKHRRSQDFRLGGPEPQITCHDVIRNFEKGIFCRAKISKNERSEAVDWCCWHVTIRNSFKEQGLNLKRKKSKVGDVCWVEKCTVIQTYQKQGSGGGAPSHRRLGQFFVNFWKKKAIPIPSDHILLVFGAIWKPVEKIKLFSFAI